MKVAVGTQPEAVEIEEGTVINFWLPTTTATKNHLPPLVFLHGFGFNGILTWQFQIPAFSRSHSVYVPDLLFFGGSFTQNPRRSPAFMAECLAKGLRKLGVERGCTVVGFSYGGIVAFKMAEMFPEMVRAVVVTGSGMEFTRSVSRSGLERLGYGSWAECLVPDTVEGMQKLLEIAAYKQLPLPARVVKDAWEVSLDLYPKERAELLEEMVIEDHNFKVHPYTQVSHSLHLIPHTVHLYLPAPLFLWPTQKEERNPIYQKMEKHSIHPLLNCVINLARFFLGQIMQSHQPRYIM
ncbi:unnamed protein product [Linum tenue]|uniref:AB hydrolase-1 domain-containing protein n=1 Tax=Linum tenue TaxID=586396 RepID=A0AAV0RG97_9ROSI|nr:unnamed protein product [Linum tenue]